MAEHGAAPPGAPSVKAKLSESPLVSTVIADPPAAPPQPPAPVASPAPEQAPVPQRTCPNCGSPMAAAQDWCLECGTGAPGSFGVRPGWRSATAIIGATVLLAAAAVAASYAALNKSSKRVVTRPPAVAQATPPTASAPAPAAALPPATATPAKPSVTPGKTPVPPITAHSRTPVPAHPVVAPVTHPVTTPAVTHTPTTTHHTSSTVSPNSAAGTPGSKVVLDPDAATTYNPYGYPDSRFGDPGLAIDQDPTTSWTAQVDPTVAPRNADGLILDLKAPQKLGQLRLQTNTPGIEVEIYGANGDTPPPSITDPAWHHLITPRKVPRDVKLRLATGGQTYRYVVLWITKAPSASPTAKMAISEVTLYH